MKLLLVSDTGFRELTDFLKIEGHTYKICTMKDCQSFIDKFIPDVTLLDWGEHSGDGLKKLRELKIQHPEIPVVAFTDNESEEVAVNAFRLGAKDYFRKPVNVLELQEVLKNLVKLRSIAMEKRFPHMTREGAMSQLFVSATTSMSPGILRSVSYMADNLSKRIDLDRLSRESGMGRYTLSRGFKKETGMSPMQFLVSMRIERAKKLLRESPLNVSVISREVGFKDLSNFIKYFKQLSGVTPTAYRKSVRNRLAL